MLLSVWISCRFHSLACIVGIAGVFLFFFFFASRRRHTRLTCDWSSDVCCSDLRADPGAAGKVEQLLERFLEKLLFLARGARICAIAGSLPPSVPAAFSARMVEELKALGVETIRSEELV